ncbi:DUF2789 family protein [Marinomonas ostreistagni]|uniref:DUF2789 family protein n=1 Tax=Marinomonas ostreistagni TaxID=359209 RepID=A0ABS0ZCI6_9GAMM|nr:DUF2789 family protein [Marinomonas ostreistagni]MBJ7551366.1 DUF2789 family protein [Marinomonas ostreistagni]
METHSFSLVHLVEQLGLEGSERSIEMLVANIAPIPSNLELWEAPEWEASQAEKIKEWKTPLSPWNEAIDQLDLLLRA